MKTDIETIKANLETLVKDENVLKAVAEALSKSKVNEPEKGREAYFLCNDGKVCECDYISNKTLFRVAYKTAFFNTYEK